VSLMILDPVKSKAVSGIGYDPDTKELQVKFMHGGLYSYQGITAGHHREIVTAKSIGRAVQGLGKGKKVL